ncbi:hypothetical protein ACFYO7_07425 [Nocardia salmonicida]|uniref:hypothetical protein n=1 Tax=Nocardia salmonicida TaxID=53431 RepID=UPI00369D9723
MERERTAEFDALFQVSEGALNDLIANAFLAGGVFPPALDPTVDEDIFAGTVYLNFQTPEADLDVDPPRVGLTIRFSNSRLSITRPINREITDVSGSIRIVDRLEMIEESGKKFAALDFVNGAPTIVIDPSEETKQALADAGIPVGYAIEKMEEITLAELRKGKGHISFTPPIAVGTGEALADIEVTTVNDESSRDKDCVSLGIRLPRESGGDPSSGIIADVTTSLIPSGSPALLAISNSLLFAKVRQMFAERFAIDESSIDEPFRLRTTVDMDELKITSLFAAVAGSRIRFDGTARKDNLPFPYDNAEATFFFHLDFAVVDGDVVVTMTKPDVEIETDLSVGVYVVGALVGFLTGGIGAGIALAALAATEIFTEALADTLFGDIDAPLDDTSLNLGRLLGGWLRIDGIELDDLELRCTVLPIPINKRNQGSHSSLQGFTLDLDSGAIGSEVSVHTDLIWDPSRGIVTNHIARLKVVATSFYALTPERISRLDLSDTAITLLDIPIRAGEVSFPFGGTEPVVFGVRTTQGRLAKVYAWRAEESGGLHLSWVTYDNPVAGIDLGIGWEELERGEPFNPGPLCQRFPTRHRATIHAEPKLMALPVNYQWCLCGNILKPGKRTVSTGNGKLRYELDGRQLTIETTRIGQSFNCELCVSGIDARGQEVFACTRVGTVGVVIENCKLPDPPRTVPRLRVIPAGPKRGNWRTLTAEIASIAPDSMVVD